MKITTTQTQSIESDSRNNGPPSSFTLSKRKRKQQLQIENKGDQNRREVLWARLVTRRLETPQLIIILNSVKIRKLKQRAYEKN
jgi:hypothetical protein